MSTPRFEESDFNRVKQDIVEVETKKQEKAQARQEKIQAKSKKKRAQVRSKLIAPIILILTLLIALMLKWAAQG